MAFSFYGNRRRPMDFENLATNPLSNSSQRFNFYDAPAARTTPGFNADFQSVAQNPISSRAAGRAAPGGGSPAPAAQGFDPVSLGLGIGSQVFSYLAGSGERKRKKQIYNELGGYASQVKGLKGRLNPENQYALSVAGFAPQIRAFDEEMSRRYGFDSGVAGRYLANKLIETLGTLRPELEQGAAEFDLNTLTRAADITSARGQYV